MNLEQRLDSVAEQAISEKRIVGTVLMVRQAGHSLYEKAHGFADREHGRPMTLDSIFRLSSLTKPIVAATILALVDDGKIRLTDQVTDYLPTFRPKLANGTMPPITIHHLLTHTSGLSSATILSEAEAKNGVNRWRLPLDEIMERLASLPLLFAPGTGWSYGPSTDVLGIIAGNLVNGTLEAAIRHYIADPLEMADTRFLVADPQRLATAYADSPEGAVPMTDPHRVPNKWGGVTMFDPGRVFDSQAFQSAGGGMAGPAGDFVRLLEVLRTGGGGLLHPETVAMGLANQTSQLAFAQSPGWQFSFFGAWLDDATAAGTPAARGTNRWGGIYGHNWFIDSANELTVLSMSNTGLEGSDGAYVTEVRDAIYASLGGCLPSGRQVAFDATETRFMRIATWNINGIKARLSLLVTWLEQEKPDVVVLQEIKSVDEAFPRAEIEALGYNVETHGQKSWNGVAILSLLPFDEVTRGLPGDDSDEQARLIEAVISVESGVVRVCGIYLPNGNPVDSEKYPYKLAWMRRLETFVAGRLAMEEPFILLGDFNLIPEPIDAHNPEGWWGDALYRPESLERWRSLMSLGLTDAVRATTAEPSYTFWDFQAGAWRRNAGIRIDHLLLSPQAADRLEGVTVHKDVRGWDKPSDHVPVEGAFSL